MRITEGKIMKLRFWIGVTLIVVAAGLFSYRGLIVGYVIEKWEKRSLPRPISAEQILGGQASAILRDAAATPFVTASGTEESPTNVGDEDFTVVGRDSSVAESTPHRTRSGAGLPPNDGVLAPHPNPLPRGEDALMKELPDEFNLAVPFTSQAPFEDWSLPYKEACEEASVAMVDAFYTGRTFNQSSATTEILSLVEWENKTFGYYEDTTAEETARVLRERYGYKTVRIVYSPTIDMIKREVAQGHPVILPAAGQMLGNRYFQTPGPLYHMLVVRGWTKSGMIITNDPGTKRGEGYLYKPEVLMSAVHDWNGGDVYNGKKVMIAVEK